MPRPKTKDQLLELSQANYDKLNKFIDELSPSERETEFPKGTLNRNIRDVMAHLHHWHQLVLGWYQVGLPVKNLVFPLRDILGKHCQPLIK